MARFRVSRAAQADIREIGRNTQQQWGKDQRRIYLDGLNDRFQLLANTPLLAAERLTFDPPVRIHPYQRHLIVYVIEDGGILIVRVLLDKGEQMSNWAAPTLTESQQAYAANDVLYLHRIWVHLEEKIKDQGRQHWLAQALRWLPVRVEMDLAGALEDVDIFSHH